MKIIRRSIVLWNIIFFTFLSVVLFHISGSDLINSSAFSIESFYAAKPVYIALGSLILLTSFCVMLAWRASTFFFTTVVLSVFTMVTLHLWDNFNKLILVLLFIYLVIAYYYYQFLNIEVKQACYNPNYSKRDLFDPMLYKIECSLQLENGSELKGVLTNWDENGCFVQLEQASLLPSRVNLTVQVMGEQFADTAQVVARFGNNHGYGLKFKDRIATKQTWQHFINFAQDMGLEPEIVQ